MANVVYRDTNDLFKNNYYFALSTPSSCNPTNLPSSHTGIADSGASGIYFSPNAPVTNLNSLAPAVGVRVANGLPVTSVASATLASTPSLPPDAMQGHVMPSFPHTLIGLGPFANLGCKIVFTKPAVSVIHLDGHSILEGWRKHDGPCLWQFLLKPTKPPDAPPTYHPPVVDSSQRGCNGSPSQFPATAGSNPGLPPTMPLPVTKPSLLVATLSEQYEETGPRGSAANFFNQPFDSTINASPPLPAAISLPLLPPRQLAASLMSKPTRTPSFDPCRLDRPSIGALIGFYHACLSFPAKLTWLDAIKAGNCKSFKCLTYSCAAK
jgi:hypothetical protein